MNLGGSLTRQVEQDCSVSEASPHIANIGRLVEDMENKIRNTLNEIYFGKTRDIVNGLRSVVPLKDANTAKDLQVREENIDKSENIFSLCLQKELLQTITQKNAGQNWIALKSSVIGGRFLKIPASVKF